MFIVGLCYTGTANGQRLDSLELLQERKYNERIQQEALFGVYIPKDLADAFSQLDQLTSRQAKEKFRQVPEKEAVKQLHFSLGRWIIYNWGFYQGSRLGHYLKRYGVSHPDDMARLVMTAWHRYLNRRDLDLAAIVEELQTIRRILAPQGGWVRDTLERRKLSTDGSK